MIVPEPLQVSVVVPAFNRPETLAGCLEALAAQQTSRTWEVIVIDDGSSDNLSDVESRFKERIPLTWVRMPVNGGPARARNAGIGKARGEIVLFTDADCRPEPGWIDALSAPFDDPGVTGAKGVYKTAQTDLWAKLAQLEFEERFELLSGQPDIDFVDSYSGGFRRAALVAVGGFDTSFPRADNEDVDLSFRIKALGGRFVFVPGAVVWHTHREGAWRYFLLKIGRGYWRMRVYRRHPGKAGRDSYTPFSLKAQLVLLAVLPVLLLSPRYRRRLLPVWLISWVATCVSLARISLRRDPSLLPWTPVLPFVRGVALIIGMVKGIAAAAAERLRDSSR
ncbi:MAG TPA: glycosyltransferase [Candidatus Ozemobacteraceae bacterium]|mgnify:CR=1 FL=1|nr:glycosyltransferase [Candidatus Ozemobacteraceae bacterium]